LSALLLTLLQRRLRSSSSHCPFPTSTIRRGQPTIDPDLPVAFSSRQPLLPLISTVPSSDSPLSPGSHDMGLQADVGTICRLAYRSNELFSCHTICVSSYETPIQPPGQKAPSLLRVINDSDVAANVRLCDAQQSLTYLLDLCLRTARVPAEGRRFDAGGIKDQGADLRTAAAALRFCDAR
jgi:hypothetical protein